MPAPKPSLSLEYGGTRNGRLGVGWGVSGLSTITPCAQTMASEGVTDGVDFDRTDSFCLDGGKLVHDESDGYVPGQRIYRTESESFRRITANYSNADDNQPAEFIVETRDGRILTYEPLTATTHYYEGQEPDGQPGPGRWPFGDWVTTSRAKM